MDERIGGFVIIDYNNIIAINHKAVKDMFWDRHFKKAYIYTSGGDHYYSVPCNTEQDFIDLIKKFEVEGRE